MAGQYILCIPKTRTRSPCLLSLSALVAKVDFPAHTDEASIPLLNMASNSDPRDADADQKSPVVTPTSVLRPSLERNRWSHAAAGVLADPALQGLSLYDKKCVLVNREIDGMGMGKYQWYIWALCGFGYMLDLLWAQAFSLTLSPLQQELGFGNDESGNISTSFSAGLTAGAFFWGVMSDLIGKTTTATLPTTSSH